MYYNVQCMNKSELFINNYNHCLVSIFSEYADEKNTDYRSCCQYSIHIDKRLYKPGAESKKGIHYIIMMVFVLLNWH